MLKVKLITVGTLKEEYLRAAAAEYEKRLGAFCRFEHVLLKEERIGDTPSQNEIRAVLEREAAKIIEQIPSSAFCVALCVEGKQYDSPALARLIGKMADESGKIALIIGSSHGLSDEVKRACEVRLSVSALTFPHQLMRVVLLEALYRSFTILAGKAYHK